VDTRAKGMLCEQWVYNCDDATRTNQVDSRQRRVAPCDGMRSSSRLCVGSDDERGIARAGVLRRGHVVCMCAGDVKPRQMHQRGGDLAAAARHAKQSLSTVSTTFCTSGP